MLEYQLLACNAEMDAISHAMIITYYYNNVHSNDAEMDGNYANNKRYHHNTLLQA